MEQNIKLANNMISDGVYDRHVKAKVNWDIGLLRRRESCADIVYTLSKNMT